METASSGLDHMRRGVYRLDVSLDEFDAGSGQSYQFALTLPRVGSFPGHDPELGHAHREGLLPLDQDDAVLRRQEPSQVTRCCQTTDTGAQHKNGLAAHRYLLSQR